MCSSFQKKKNQFPNFLNSFRKESENMHMFIKMILIDWYLNCLILSAVKKHMILIEIFENIRGLIMFLIPAYQDSIPKIFRCLGMCGTNFFGSSLGPGAFFYFLVPDPHISSYIITIEKLFEIFSQLYSV